MEYSSSKVYLFPGRHSLGHIHPDSADKILRAAFTELGIEGATHSFCRTSLTQMHRSGGQLLVIQKISGHKTKATLQKYLEVLDEDLEEAISKLKFWRLTTTHRSAQTTSNLELQLMNSSTTTRLEDYFEFLSPDDIRIKGHRIGMRLTQTQFSRDEINFLLLLCL